ncbi:hypothetical protein JK211_14545 [Tatumella sp. JGM130]|uniref:hypothetical protein n=1 Tax=Tatumella sp. JGM130 TaxID=2799797 RepID=UPI001BAEEB72|nr:hypothetical protein [Tatumella sp. JGM130]MBS0895234.1 hypothetical protein [Tatumella sp. JGM130]
MGLYKLNIEEKNTKLQEIINWLNKFEVKNYVINKNLIIDVYGDVVLCRRQLTELPFKFGKIYGFFNIDFNKIRTLRNCPEEIYGSFYCSSNLLKDLKYSPKIINGDFHCYYNRLTSLEGSPKYIKGSFDCSSNQLTSLKYCPNKITGNFNCCGNKLRSLKHCPEEIYGDFECNGNRIGSLKYCPKIIKGGFSCYSNKINEKSLIGFNSHIEGYIVSDVGFDEEFYDEVKKQKSIHRAIKEKNVLLSSISDSEPVSRKKRKRL